MRSKRAEAPSSGTELLARAQGRSGELLLRCRGGDLEVIAGGSFLMSSANAASSAALVTAGLDVLAAAGRARGIKALAGGLGLGYSLDTALSDPRIDRVTAVEIEPAIVEWFRTFGEGRAARLAAAEAAGRAQVVVGDVLDHLRANPGVYDLITLDTDNGPDWLVRQENAAIYAEAGLATARAALRPGGVATYWSPERNAEFVGRVNAVFGRVRTSAAHDTIGGRRFAYTMFVAEREREDT